jgi:hypothetical protein
MRSARAPRLILCSKLRVAAHHYSLQQPKLVPTVEHTPTVAAHSLRPRSDKCDCAAPANVLRLFPPSGALPLAPPPLFAPWLRPARL